MNVRFEPPTIRDRGIVVRAVAKAMHEAGQAMAQGERDGRLRCAACAGVIRWSGSGTRSAGSCCSCRVVRWAQQ